MLIILSIGRGARDLVREQVKVLGFLELFRRFALLGMLEMLLLHRGQSTVHLFSIEGYEQVCMRLLLSSTH